jgi:hypothetical protein
MGNEATRYGKIMPSVRGQNHQPPARAQDAGEFREGQRWILEVFYDVVGEDQIEGPAGKWYMLEVTGAGVPDLFVLD